MPPRTSPLLPHLPRPAYSPSQFTRRIFGLPPHHFLDKHLTMLRALRHLLAPGALPPLGEALLGSMAQELSRLPDTGQVRSWVGDG